MLTVFFSEGKLVKNLSNPEADFKAIQMQGIRKAWCDGLQGLLHMGDEGSVVLKEKITDQPI